MMQVVRSPWTRVIGIVGGLGPHSHLAFERHLLEAAGGVLTEQEYPPWVLVSDPGVPDRTQAITAGGTSPVRWLLKSLHNLKAAGAGFAVIVCNTAHFFLPQLQQRVLPILDMVAEGLCDRRINRNGVVGVLATTGTLHGRVYETTAQRIGFKGKILTMLDVDPSGELQERLVMEPIYGRNDGLRVRGIKHGGAAAEESGGVLRDAVTHLVSAGAQSIIMGCTEIPLVLYQRHVGDVPLIDPMAAAALSAIAIAKGQREVTPDLTEAR